MMLTPNKPFSLRDKWCAMMMDEGLVQVFPIDDSRQHFEETCECEPQFTLIDNTEGALFGFMITHNAWDGRE